MASTDHELPLLLFRASPATLARLVRAAYGVELGEGAREVGASFAQLTPGPYVADLVLTGQHAFVIEVQRQREPEKRRSWPLYLASAHAADPRPTWLVVVALDEHVASWAREPIETFHGGALVPLVIGPAEIPAVVDRAEALAAPELAVLSALVHGRGRERAAVGAAALAGAASVRRRDEDRGKLYTDAVLHALGDIARVLLEEAMKLEGYEWKSELVKEWLAEGRAEGLREAVRTLCSALGVEWTEARASVVARLDPAALDQLLARLARERAWPES